MDIQSDNMRSQEGLVKAVIVHDGSIPGDGVKGKVEISGFEDMASYNWTKTSVPTASLGHKLSPYGTPLSMSGSTSLVALPEKQPGKLYRAVFTITSIDTDSGRKTSSVVSPNLRPDQTQLRTQDKLSRL